MRKLAILLAVALPALAQQPATPAPPSLVREGVTEKLTDHVWAIPDGSASLVPNVGIIVGKQAVLVIETGMGARNAETILKEVAKVGAGKPIYLVTTHVHPEHDMGAHVFPKDSKLIRSKDQVADIAAGAGMSLVPLFTARSDLNKELLRDAQHRPADITFDREYMLDLGGVEIIEGYRRYLTRIRDRAAGLKKAGKSQDETIQAITDEMVAQYPDKNRLAGAIRAAYSE